MADKDKMDLESALASPQTAKSATSHTAGSSGRFAVGQLILHRYKILGRAPFDQTAFRAKDIKSDRIVAIRPLVADVVSGGHKLELLAQEVARLRGLQHSNLIQLFDLESGHKPPFVVSELAKGFSLQELLQARSGLAWEEAVQILKPIANVLDFASGEQILNGRISPRRIFIDISSTKEEPAELLQMLVFTWPSFTVRVDPLTFVRLDSHIDGKGVPPDAAAISNVRALTLLTYELLGGAKSMTSAAVPNLAPLPVLSASANSTLSTGVTNPASFRTSNEFLAAMERAVAKRNDRVAATSKKDSLPDPGKKDSLPEPGKKDSPPERGKKSGARATPPKAPVSTRYHRRLPSVAKVGVVGLFVAIAAAAGVLADLMLRKTQVPLPIPRPETLFVPKQPVTAIVGQISINSTPDGSAFEISDANEQVTRGVTPTTVDNLLVGQYRIRLQHSGWPAHLETVNVQPGKTTTFNHTFPTFDVKLRSDPPGATIFKDQFELGKTPLTVSLPPEPIELVSRIADLEPVRMRVVPDPNHASTVEFKHQYGTLAVSSNRHDAEVSIEGSSTGNPPMERVLPPGRYSVLVRAPGFPDQTEVADVQTGQRMVMAFNFAPPPPSGEVASSGGQQNSPSTPMASPAPGNSPTASDSSAQGGSGSVASSPQSENSPQSSGSPSPSIAPSPTTSSLASSAPSPGKSASPENPPQRSSAPSPVATPATESTLASSSPPPSNSPSADSLPSPSNSASPSTASHPTIAPATTSSSPASNSSRSSGSPRSTDSTAFVSQPPRSPKHSRPRATPKPTPSPPAFPLGFRTKEEYEKARDDAFRQFNGEWDTQKRELEKSKTYSEYWATRTTGAERDQWVADNQRTQQSLSDFENQRNAAREALKKKWLGQQ
jgi:PEGA domain-containing protein/protein tyrosine kinase